MGSLVLPGLPCTRPQKGQIQEKHSRATMLPLRRGLGSPFPGAHGRQWSPEWETVESRVPVVAGPTWMPETPQPAAQPRLCFQTGQGASGGERAGPCKPLCPHNYLRNAASRLAAESNVFKDEEIPTSFCYCHDTADSPSKHFEALSEVAGLQSLMLHAPFQRPREQAGGHTCYPS